MRPCQWGACWSRWWVSSCPRPASRSPAPWSPCRTSRSSSGSWSPPPRRWPGRWDGVLLSGGGCDGLLRHRPVEAHPDVELGVGLVGDLEHDGARQEVQRHRGDLRYVVVSWKVVMVYLCSKVDGDRGTDVVGHPWHHHEVIRHGEHVVHVKLGEASVQVGVEKIHELHQLINKGVLCLVRSLAWSIDLLLLTVSKIIHLSEDKKDTTPSFLNFVLVTAKGLKTAATVSFSIMNRT